MSISYKRIALTLLVGISFCALLLLPDYLYAAATGGPLPNARLSAILPFLALSIGLAFLRSRWLFYIIVLFFCLLQLVQFSAIAYFGTSISPFSIALMSKETSDVLLESESEFVHYLWIGFVVLTPFAIIVFLRNKLHRSLAFTRFSIIVLIFALGYLPYRATRAPITYFMPSESRYSVDNSYRAFSGYVFNVLPQDIEGNYKAHDYKDYIINRIMTPKPVTIVFVLGESVNPSHMSLFGYDKETTPLLKSKTSDPAFFYAKGLGSAVTTMVAANMVFQTRREPDNLKVATGSITNLFRLAKEADFKTFYISAQNSNLLRCFNTQYIDVIRTAEDYKAELKKRGEEYLIDVLRQQKLDPERNFIVIHQRNQHVPYESNYAFNKRKFSKFDCNKEYHSSREPASTADCGRIGYSSREAYYDNSMLYNDYLLSKYMKAIPMDYFIFVSDHSEMMGLDGKYWGHVTLRREVATVPILAYSHDTAFIDRLRENGRVGHYEISKEIARLLGYEIINPNDDGSLFVNGKDMMGRDGSITVHYLIAGGTTNTLRAIH